MKKAGGRRFCRRALQLIIFAIALSALGGCYYPGYYQDASSYPDDPGIEASPPSATFYRDDTDVPIYYQGYPYYSYYPYYPYYPPDYGNPFYQYYH